APRLRPRRGSQLLVRLDRLEQHAGSAEDSASARITTSPRTGWWRAGTGQRRGFGLGEDHNYQPPGPGERDPGQRRGFWQGTLGTARWRSLVLPADGRQICPVAAIRRLRVGVSSGGSLLSLRGPG